MTDEYVDIFGPEIYKYVFDSKISKRKLQNMIMWVNDKTMTFGTIDDSRPLILVFQCRYYIKLVVYLIYSSYCCGTEVRYLLHIYKVLKIKMILQIKIC